MGIGVGYGCGTGCGVGEGVGEGVTEGVTLGDTLGLGGPKGVIQGCHAISATATRAMSARIRARRAAWWWRR